jgi:VWFA-related protein
MPPWPLHRRISVALAAALLAFSATASDRQLEHRTFSDRLEVVESTAEVVVTDRRGEPILGLGPVDFLVRLGSREAQVVAVEYVGYQSAGGSTPSANRKSPIRPTEPSAGGETAERYFVVLIHDLLFLSDRSTLGLLSQRMRTVRGLQEWVREELAPDDRIALAVYHGRLQPYLDLTGSRKELQAALDRIAARRPPPTLAPAIGKGISLFRRLPAGGELRDRTTTLAKGLQALADAAFHLPGYKHLLLFSIGAELSGGGRGLLDRVARPGLLRSLRGAGVVTYALDLTPPTAEHARASSLISLAEATGGSYFGHLEGFDKPLRRISRQLAGYYRLSYLQPAARPGGERQSVHVQVRRRGAGVRLLPPPIRSRD